MATALLVIDMQHIFAPMTTAALPNITKLIAHFADHSLPRIFTQHGHSKDELTPPYTNQLVRKWGPSGSIAAGSKDWELQPEIAHLVGDSPVVAKNTYDAFLNTKLEQILQEKGVHKVVVCGTMTDCCCDTTARSAFNRGFETWLVDDACGTASPAQHKAGLNGFGYAFGDVFKTSAVMAQVK